jgi:predicted nucleic acid-binding protein
MSVLVDTPVWIDHFHRSDAELCRLLQDDRVCVAAPVIGELAAGTLPNRRQTLHMLRLLRCLAVPPDDDVLDWIEMAKLAGKGLSWVDCLLLATARHHRVTLWTRDKILRDSARHLRLDHRAD